jgi:hypothetical protein
MGTEREAEAEAKEREDKLRAEIEALAAALQAAVSDQVHFLAPGYWRLGEMLAASSATLDVKYQIAKGERAYYLAQRVHKYFPTLADAEAYDGSLRHLRDITRKGIKGRGPASAVDKALEALLDAVDGNPEEAVRLVIERHWNFPDALDWAQKAAEQQGILAMPSSF